MRTEGGRAARVGIRTRRVRGCGNQAVRRRGRRGEARMEAKEDCATRLVQGAGQSGEWAPQSSPAYPDPAFPSKVTSVPRPRVRRGAGELSGRASVPLKTVGCTGCYLWRVCACAARAWDASATTENLPSNVSVVILVVSLAGAWSSVAARSARDSAFYLSELCFGWRRAAQSRMTRRSSSDQLTRRFSRSSCSGTRSSRSLSPREPSWTALTSLSRAALRLPSQPRWTHEPRRRAPHPPPPPAPRLRIGRSIRAGLGPRVPLRLPHLRRAHEYRLRPRVRPDRPTPRLRILRPLCPTLGPRLRRMSPRSRRTLEPCRVRGVEHYGYTCRLGVRRHHHSIVGRRLRHPLLHP